ncbi:Phosphatidate cytidylyltransferase [Caenorhabditis elegans]|uniref:Phosphatidate cytidylyltransferase n=1 Tax=Caenorhabditis elegans TaxID=6239 RepID=C1P652_CAEEL|nr:Phosphatidate cytidylyltransferase [Caenorhabditis elegans]CAX65066.1 Phosphatidate cytidylyltransferase [Caenorhabditis elegans]|eukprot:NP_001256913.1 Uncharacterized protein CELE_K02E2.11 [Caenorhabditis elegans]
MDLEAKLNNYSKRFQEIILVPVICNGF